MTDLHCLIIEEKPKTARFISKNISALGNVAYVALSFKQAIVTLQTEYLEIVFTDLHTFDCKDVSIITHLKVAHPNLIIIGMTDSYNLKEAKKMGAHHLLQKPFCKNKIEETLNKLIKITEKKRTIKVTNRPQNQKANNF